MQLIKGIVARQKPPKNNPVAKTPYQKLSKGFLKCFHVRDMTCSTQSCRPASWPRLCINDAVGFLKKILRLNRHIKREKEKEKEKYYFTEFCNMLEATERYRE